MQSKKHLYEWAKLNAGFFTYDTGTTKKEMLAAINEVIDAWDNLDSEPPDICSIDDYEHFYMVRRALEAAHYKWTIGT